MITRDMHDNPGFIALRSRLEALGCSMRCLWQGRTTDARERFKYPDLECLQIIGDGKRPAIGTLIVQDYGEDGLGIWLDTETVDLDRIAARIAG